MTMLINGEHMLRGYEDYIPPSDSPKGHPLCVEMPTCGVWGLRYPAYARSRDLISSLSAVVFRRVRP